MSTGTMRSATSSTQLTSSKKLEEPPPGARHGRELDEDRGDVEVERLEQHGEATSEHRPAQQARCPRCASGRASRGRSEERRRDEQRAREGDVTPGRERRACLPRPRSRRESAATTLVRRQLCAHQGPSALKASQKARFVACSSSEASMSGVTSASIVGVNRWIARAVLDLSARGKRRVQARDGHPAHRRQIFGCTTWSSRASQPRLPPRRRPRT